ncbi:unnamed protein product [Phytophthora fragariaefolia]|uniref:Unnamed protein product n=1 Tax=Phytophthora fragariaefolia TaxID=1490495 RepID=A0A9W6Y355_9STRA|nr:unnamed protein product [Phytophthora fragariaefolia]
MASSLKRGFDRQSDVLAWRREVNHQQEIAAKLAKEYQAVEKARRASEHNNSLSRQENAPLPRTMVNENSGDNLEDTEHANEQEGEGPRSLFEPDDSVCLAVPVSISERSPGSSCERSQYWMGTCPVFQIQSGKLAQFESGYSTSSRATDKTNYGVIVAFTNFAPSIRRINRLD